MSIYIILWGNSARGSSANLSSQPKHYFVLPYILSLKYSPYFTTFLHSISQSISPLHPNHYHHYNTPSYNNPVICSLIPLYYRLIHHHSCASAIFILSPVFSSYHNNYPSYVVLYHHPSTNPSIHPSTHPPFDPTQRHPIPHYQSDPPWVLGSRVDELQAGKVVQRKYLEHLK